VVQELESRGIKVENLAIDDSGSQSVADIVQVESKVAPIRCNFGARASDNPISGINPEPAYKRVADQATEIWVMFAELVRSGQVRGLVGEATSQFTTRSFVEGRRPQRLEPKAKYKQRTGKSSPDEADATALCALAARQAAGLFPGREKKVTPWVGATPWIPKKDPSESGYKSSGLESLQYSDLTLSAYVV